MSTLQTTVKDRIAIIQLDRGKSNAINMEMMSELSQMVSNVEKDDQIGGLLLTGKEGFFSSGLDLIALYGLNEKEAREFWQRFMALTTQLLAFPKPMAVSITGHSPAGGCVLSLCADYRVMAKGEYIIGLNEIPVGVIAPEFIFHLYSFWVGERKAYQMLLEGKLNSPEEALKIGLVDELVDFNTILGVTEKKLRLYMSFEPNTWQESKKNLRRDLMQKMSVNRDQNLEIILQQWWSPGTRNALKAIIDNFGKK